MKTRSIVEYVQGRIMGDVLRRIRENPGTVLNNCAVFENTVDAAVKWQILDHSEEFESLDGDSLAGFADLIGESISEEISPFFETTGGMESGIAFFSRACLGCPRMMDRTGSECLRERKGDMIVGVGLLDALQAVLERGEHGAGRFDTGAIMNLLLSLRGGEEPRFRTADERRTLVESLEKCMGRSLRYCNSEDIIVFSRRIAPFIPLSDGLEQRYAGQR